jgi:hypothetical protein
MFALAGLIVLRVNQKIAKAGSTSAKIDRVLNDWNLAW